MNKLRKNDLVNTFVELEGNPKWSLITEPLWFIPHSLYLPFASLYMYQKGLSSEQIGMTISIGFALQVLFALLGGIITDKMGRRKTTIIFDTISWSIPCVIWAFADNYWWFLLAAVINASYQITNASWNCLFVEDCPAKHLTNAFTLVHLCGMLSVFFSPIAIFFVDKYSVIQVVSILYIISAISMTAKFVILYVCGRETENGVIRMEETKNISYVTMFMGYKSVISKIFGSTKMMFVMVFLALTNIILITTTNFFSLYITEQLHISDGLVAVFPMVRTMIMLVFVLILQNAMNRLKMKNSLVLGFIIYIASHIMLLVAPNKSLGFVLIYTVLEAVAYAIIVPRKDALMAFYVDEGERSRIYAIFNAGIIAISAPFGIIIGKLFEVNKSYPFVMNIILIGIAMCLVAKARMIANYDRDVREKQTGA